MIVTIKKTLVKKVEVPKRIKNSGDFERWYRNEEKKLLTEREKS